jgi:hypothetical protein
MLDVHSIQGKQRSSILSQPCLTNTNDSVHRHINTRRVARRVTQQVDICATQLLDLGQPRDSSVVLQLLFPVRLLFHPVRHRRLDQTRRYRVDADPVLRPFHSEGMRHVLHACFRGAVGCGGYALVRAMRGHGRGEHDGALDALLDESSCRAARGVERAVEVHAPELVDLFGCEVQGGLVLCAAGVSDHAVQSTGFRENLVDGGLDRFFFCHVGLQSEDLAWILF